MSFCRNTQEVILNQSQKDAQDSALHDSRVKCNDDDRSLLNKLQDAFVDNFYNTGDAIKESKINSQIEDLYGKDSDREKLFVKLNSLLEAYPGIVDMIEEKALIDISRPIYKKKIRDSIIKDGSLNYSSLPKSLLNTLIGTAQEIIKNGYGQNLGRGVIGKLLVEHTTPRKLRKYDSTGAIAMMANAVIDFTKKVSLHVTRFNNEDMFTKGKNARNYGMKDVMSNVINMRLMLSQDLKNKLQSEGRSIADSYLMDTFWRIMQGWMYYDENTKRFMINNNYGPVKDEEGKYLTYEDGNLVHKFSDPVVIEDYQGWNEHTPIEVNDSYIALIKEIESNKELLNTLLKQEKSAREIHDDVWEYALKESEKTKNRLHKALKKYFPGLTRQEIFSFFYTEDKKSQIIRENAEKKLNKEQKENIYYLMENFGQYSILEPFIMESAQERYGVSEDGKPQKKKGSFPIIFHQDKMPLHWQDYIGRLEQEIQNIQKSTDLTHLEKKELITTLSFDLNKARWVFDRMLEYPEDSQGRKIPANKDVKHLKRITNAIDIRHSRRDAAGYNEYLRSTFSSIERNNLTAILLEALLTAKSNGARDAILSQYNGILNDPSARSSFLTVPLDLDSVTSFLGKVGIKISSQTLSRKLRVVSGWITGMYLRKFTTAVTNSTAIIEGHMAFGEEVMKEARELLAQDKDGKLRDIVKQSGIVEFNEFIAEGLVQTADSLDISSREATRLYNVIDLYWKKIEAIDRKGLSRKESIIKRAKAEQEMRENLSINIKGIISKEKIKKLKGINNSRRRIRAVNRFAEYAINAEYNMPAGIKNKLLRSILSKVETWAEIRKKLPTMGKTEEELRTLMFVVGVIGIQRAGYLGKTNKPIWELRGNDLKMAIQAGKTVVQKFCFSVGRENIGERMRGPVGSLLAKFKIWGDQKFSSDIDKFGNAWKETADHLNNQSTYSHLGDLFSKLFRFRKYPNRVLQKTYPHVYNLRNFLAVQGSITGLMDFIVFGPFTWGRHIPFVGGPIRKLFYSNPVSRSVGGATSDLLSLSMLIPALACTLAFGDDPEDEDWSKIFSHYMRRSMLGFGITWTAESIGLLIDLLIEENERERSEKIVRTLSPVIPSELHHTAKEVIEYIED